MKGAAEGGAAPNTNNTEAVPIQESTMGGRLSLHELTQQWYEAKVTEARVSDTNLMVEVESRVGEVAGHNRKITGAGERNRTSDRRFTKPLKHKRG